MKTRIIQDGPEPADAEERPSDSSDTDVVPGDEDGADVGVADRPSALDPNSTGGTP